MAARSRLFYQCCEDLLTLDVVCSKTVCYWSAEKTGVLIGLSAHNPKVGRPEGRNMHLTKLHLEEKNETLW
jgi:hypothetical protein